MNRTPSPTLRLVASSAPVGISGALRLYIAYLFAGIPPLPLPCLAAGLVIYAIYTLDRTLDCPEDAINQAGLAGADRSVALAVCGVAFLGGATLFAWERLYLVPLYPLLIGFLYTRGITWGPCSLKLKGGSGRKNLVIGLTWGGAIALVIGQQALSPVIAAAIFVFYGLKLFINSVIYDLKDLEGDLAAGIRTLPAVLGERRVKQLLILLTLLLHAGMLGAILGGFMRPELLILGYSFMVSLIFLLWYSVEKENRATGVNRYVRVIAIDGESGIALALRWFTGWAPGVIAPGCG